MTKFELGSIVATVSVIDRMTTDYAFNHFIDDSLNRFRECDWGDITEDDWNQMERNLKDGEYLQGVYTMGTDGTVIWIFTEPDRRATTILFPHEW